MDNLNINPKTITVFIGDFQVIIYDLNGKIYNGGKWRGKIFDMSYIEFGCIYEREWERNVTIFEAAEELWTDFVDEKQNSNE